MKRRLFTGGVAVAVVAGTVLPAGALVLGHVDRPTVQTEAAVTVAAEEATTTTVAPPEPHPTTAAPTTTEAPPTTTTEAPKREQPPATTTPPKGDDTPAHPTFRNHCALRTNAVGVVCEWTAYTDGPAHYYRIWRVTDEGPRATALGSTEGLRWVDETVEAGHSYLYVIEALGPERESLGYSNGVRIAVPPQVVPFKLGCTARIVENVQAVVCEWTASTKDGVRGYRLVKRVGDGERQTLAQIGLDGRRRFVDTAVQPGQHIYYVVLALDAAGAVVEETNTVRVDIPQPPAPTTTTAPRSEPPLTTVPVAPTGTA
jgi:hypothetical protein